MAEGDGANKVDDGKTGGDGGGSGGDGKTGGDGSGVTAPSVEEATALLTKFQEAGIKDPSGALDTIKKLRDYEKGDKLPATVAKELEDLRAQVKAAEDAKLSDTDRLSKRVTELEEELSKSRDAAATAALDTEIVSAARKAGAIDPDAMPSLIDKAGIEKDAKGAPTNIDKLLADLRKSKPMWFGKPGTFDGGARGNGDGDGKTDMNALIRQKAGRT